MAERPDLAAASRSHRNAPRYVGLGRSPRRASVRAECGIRQAVHDVVRATRSRSWRRRVGSHVLFSQRCGWHSAWSGSLLLTAMQDTPESIPAVERWIETWVPRVSRAIAAFHTIFDEMAARRRRALRSSAQRDRAILPRLPRIPFRPSRSTARRIEVMADAFPGIP